MTIDDDFSSGDAALDIRAEVHWPVAVSALRRLYGSHPEFSGTLDKVRNIALAARAARSEELRALDEARLAAPDWFMQASSIGYSAYVDRFAGRLGAVEGKLDYLRELGVTGLHLLPLMQSRAGQSDGGFAVVDHLRVDPRFGSNDDLTALSRALRARGMSLCLDLLCNHTAREHHWARKAASGDPRYKDHYLFFDRVSETSAFAPWLDEVFPLTAPGNFSHDVETGRWVWTTFYPYQWDLNYQNPLVFCDMLEVMLSLANLGADVLRLDSVAFMWKRAGTNCRNLPEVHALLEAFRALTAIAAPGLILKAEAIVETAEIAAYLGRPGAPPQCQLAYHNSLMVSAWSALADGDAREISSMLARVPAIPDGTTWTTYVRCHDDIGWGVLGRDLGAEGDARARYLSAFYAGQIPGSFARGATFQAATPDAVHGAAGSLASLAGLEAAQGEPGTAALAVARITLLHAMTFFMPGAPVIYMGDEIGLLNDQDWESRAWAAEDCRGLHRPPMDWQAAARRHDLKAVEGQLFGALKALASARAACPALHGSAALTVMDSPDRRVLLARRDRAGQGLLLAANFSDAAVSLTVPLRLKRNLLDGAAQSAGGSIALAPYAVAWLEIE